MAAAAAAAAAVVVVVVSAGLAIVMTDKQNLGLQ